jgi:hypothetical protein
MADRDCESADSSGEIFAPSGNIDAPRPTPHARESGLRVYCSAKDEAAD